MKKHKTNSYWQSYKTIFKLLNSISSPDISSNLYEYLVLPLRKNKIPPESNFSQKDAKHTDVFRKADMYQQKMLEITKIR